MQGKQDGAMKGHSDFSIEHILKRAGDKNKAESSTTEDHLKEVDMSSGSFSWLQCTRFCPPRVPRFQRREGPQKRQLGRYPRIPFTNQQIAILEEKFQQSPYLSSEEAIALSKKLHLADVKVKIWFQNRRARKRREEIGDIKKELRTNQQKEVPAKTPAASVSSRNEASTSGFVQNTVPMSFIYISPHTMSEFNT